MAAVDADGNTMGDMTENWGKCCAAQYFYGSKSASNRDRITSAIAEHQRNEQVQRDMLMRRVAIDNTYEHTTERYTGSGYRITESSTITVECVLSAANVKYQRTGLPIAGSIVMVNDNGHMVRTCADRPQERKFYASMGFRIWTR